MKFIKLKKLKANDEVAILSPSFAAPGVWPHVYELGLKRIREIFKLKPIEYPTTKKVGATKEERAADLIKAFQDKNIKAIITSLGGNDQVTYIKNLPKGPFIKNPKPFFGYSDNTHFMNFLWLNNIPSFYGGAVFTQFAKQGSMDDFTLKYLNVALFQKKEMELEPSKVYNDIDLNWDDPKNLTLYRTNEPNMGWVWDGNNNSKGISWGGCLESIDEMLRHGIKIPSLTDFENVILFTETSEEIPDHNYVYRVYRALGERGILGKVKGILVGRPKAWEFSKQLNTEQKEEYRSKQREIILKTIRQYNKKIPVVQNIDFGHTDPQIPLPYGGEIKIDSKNKKIIVKF
jgi:muramoyltetrapeptide carboxypeptidase LdcA involved in peptidoglycan recycling